MPSLVIDQQVIDAAMQKLVERQRQRAAGTALPAARPAEPAQAGFDEPYSFSTVTARKIQMLRGYDARLIRARAALRQRLTPPQEVRRLSAERAALQGLPLDELRTLLIDADQQNAQRLQRYQSAFGDLPTAARTVAVILMKSGQIEFATPLPEDPLTREVEEARGVRRVYFQFYLHPPNESPRRHNGFVEFVYDATSALWVPTWANYSGDSIPLFDAEAFVPLRPYDILYDGKTFVVAQAEPIRPPEVFALLTPRWNANRNGNLFAPAQRW